MLCYRFSFVRASTYHLGSLAFGSLIMAVVVLLRIIIGFIDRKTKGAPARSCARPRARPPPVHPLPARARAPSPRVRWRPLLACAQGRTLVRW